jgi:hypothetical protein
MKFFRSPKGIDCVALEWDLPEVLYFPADPSPSTPTVAPPGAVAGAALIHVFTGFSWGIPGGPMEGLARCLNMVGFDPKETAFWSREDPPFRPRVYRRIKAGWLLLE